MTRFDVDDEPIDQLTTQRGEDVQDDSALELAVAGSAFAVGVGPERRVSLSAGGFLRPALRNAAAESFNTPFNSTLEWELLSRQHFATKEQARREIAATSTATTTDVVTALVR